ncbi:sugar-transfer associated ATP-grasp domain-containing protein [Flavobacterium sp. ASW18X]|uniref:sugar-transfer associated ATP-grasp domain-containing protein n=1 Tax=Flavobacterium sp. ASW18X TaxID=2572595 RepID=UPI0010AE3DCF|nr:sugar-transfer associated ATP-grasp domain-containing protein [Flavobacterium sp. ASW18X]TKD65539.1 hypothetical protein FBT53_05325 [Flavobacterium sp. ASW18X]
MVNRIKNTLQKALVARNNYISNGIAKGILNGLEQEYGTLPKKHKKWCNDYAIDVLKSNAYAPWLWVYAHVAGDFKEGWIPDNYYRNVLIPQIQGDYGKVSFLRSLNNFVFKEDLGLDVLYQVNGVYSTPGGRVVPKEELSTYLSSLHTKILFKPDNSAQGKGIQFLKEDFTGVNLISKLENGVFQSVIKQHSFFNQFTPDNVATLRLTTLLLDTGVIKLVAAYVRLGRTGETAVLSKSHIRVPINLDNGTFSSIAYDVQWKKIAKHPDSKVSFAHCSMPGFDTAVSKVKALHQTYPFVRVIGWDIAIDDMERVKVMEWNGYSNDIKFTEATQGPGLLELF